MKTGKNLLVRGMALFMSGILFFGAMPGTVTASEILSDSMETSEVFMEPEEDNTQASEDFVEPEEDNTQPSVGFIEPEDDNTQPSVDFVEPEGDNPQAPEDLVEPVEEAGEEAAFEGEPDQTEERTDVEPDMPENQNSSAEEIVAAQNSDLSNEEIQAFQEKVRIWKFQNRIEIAYDSSEDISIEYSIFSGIDDSLLHSGGLRWDEQNMLYYDSVDFGVLNDLIGVEGPEKVDICDIPVRIVLSDGLNQYEEIISKKNGEILPGAIENPEDGRFSLSWESTGSAEGYLIWIKDIDGRATLLETGAPFLETEAQSDCKALIASYRMDGNVKCFGESVEIALSDYVDSFSGDPDASEAIAEEETVGSENVIEEETDKEENVDEEIVIEETPEEETVEEGTVGEELIEEEAAVEEIAPASVTANAVEENIADSAAKWWSSSAEALTAERSDSSSTKASTVGKSEGGSSEAASAAGKMTDDTGVSDAVLSMDGETEDVSTNALLAAVATPSDGNRYTVLLLDNSGSMSGTPLSREKAAAEKFCTQMLAADGTNYISIVTYAGDVKKAYDFTNQMDVLQSQLNGMSAYGGTNTNAALKQAVLLLNQAPETATKNIVLLSDGLPESGEQKSSGQYSSAEHSYYAYGNAVYDTAKSIDREWNLYTLGFFHALSGSNLNFGRKLMSDLPADPGMYYEVTNVDDLEFMFGKLAEDITQSDLQKIYVQQHVEYINSPEYGQEIIPGFSQSLTQVLLDVRNDSAVSGYNFCSKLSDALGFEMDLTQEYELLLANLMVNEQTYKGIKDAYLTNLESETNKVGEALIKSFDQYADAVQDSDREQMIKLFNQLMEEDYLSDKYCEIYEEYAQVVNESFSASKAKDALKDWSAGLEIADVAFSTATETIEYYCYAKAYQDTTDDFISILILLDYCAGQNAWAANIEGIKPATQLFELAAFQTAIEEFIGSMEDYKKDNAKALAEFAGEKLTSKTGSKVADKVSDLIFSQVPIFKVIPYLKGALSAGLTLVDIFTKIDDRTASGNMVEKYYITAAMLDEVADLCDGGVLRLYNAGKEGEDIFRMAARFDEAVNLYKTGTKLAADYGIEYEESLLASESKWPLPSKKKMSWYSAAISLAGVEKLRADNILCHHEGLVYNHKSDIVLDTDRLKIFTIACPVAVEVKNASGVRVAYLADDACDVVEGYEPYFYVLENAEHEFIKVVTLPEDSDFSVSIIGTGQGSMDAYLGIYDGTQITSVKEYAGIRVKEDSIGYFGDEDENGINNLVFDDVEYSTDNEHKGYSILSGEAGTGAHISTDKGQYYCPDSQTFTVTARIQTPSAFVDGSRKYTGYLAALVNGSWLQLKAWYIDGGTIAVDLPIGVSGIPLGNRLFTVSLFESDNFATGASLYDCFFRVNILPASYQLTFDPNGGSCSTVNKEITYGLPYGDLPTPTREGYVFSGWFGDKDGKTERITAAGLVKTTSDQTLYASWRPEQDLSLWVDFDANGGSCKTWIRKYREGDAYGDLPKPIRSGYIFEGWFTGESNGTKILPEMTAETGTLYAHWKKPPTSIEDYQISLSKGTFTFNGKEQLPSVKISYNHFNLVEGKDYTLSYTDNINAGTAKVTITGIGNIEGTAARTFTIIRASQSITLKSGSSSLAVGGTMPLTVTGAKGEKTFKSSNTAVMAVDTSTGKVTARKVGTASITVTSAATANYNQATAKISIKVVPASIAGAKVTCPASKVWTGWALTPVPTVKLGTKTLKKGTDFSLTFKNNKNVGRGTVTIKGKGNYTGTITRTFKINPKPTAISKLTRGTRKFTVKWKKQPSQTSGYQIQYSSRKDFKTQKIVQVTGAGKTSRTISRLIGKHKYYVRIRTYKNINGTKYYSTWSAAKTVTTK